MCKKNSIWCHMICVILPEMIKKKSPCTHNCVPCEKFCSFYTALKHSVNFFQPVKTSFLTFNIYYTTINGDKQEELLTVMYYSITKYLLESSSLTCSAGSYLGPAQFDLITKAKQKKKKLCFLLP